MAALKHNNNSTEELLSSPPPTFAIKSWTKPPLLDGPLDKGVTTLTISTILHSPREGRTARLPTNNQTKRTPATPHRSWQSGPSLTVQTMSWTKPFPTYWKVTQPQRQKDNAWQFQWYFSPSEGRTDRLPTNNHRTKRTLSNLKRSWQSGLPLTWNDKLNKPPLTGRPTRPQRHKPDNFNSNALSEGRNNSLISNKQPPNKENTSNSTEELTEWSSFNSSNDELNKTTASQTTPDNFNDTALLGKKNRSTLVHPTDTSSKTNTMNSMHTICHLQCLPHAWQRKKWVAARECNLQTRSKSLTSTHSSHIKHQLSKLLGESSTPLLYP